MNTQQEKLNHLMNHTGKSKMACDIALQLSGGDVDKAIQRMILSYPESLKHLRGELDGE